jgi:hypothetical protein
VSDISHRPSSAPVHPTSPPYAPPAPWPTAPAPTWYPAGPLPSWGTNGFAVASLVLGIAWCWWIGSILAVVFGHVALSQIAATRGRQAGRGLAIAGLTLGWIGVGTLVVVLVAAAVARVAGS